MPRKAIGLQWFFGASTLHIHLSAVLPYPCGCLHSAGGCGAFVRAVDSVAICREGVPAVLAEPCGNSIESRFQRRIIGQN